MTGRTIVVMLALMMALQGCASVEAAMAAKAGRFCGNDRQDAARGWRAVAPPPEAEAYRQRAAADPEFSSAPPRGDEYWYEAADGAVKYCITDLQLGCARDGVWWVFTQAADGAETTGADMQVCLL